MFEKERELVSAGTFVRILLAIQLMFAALVFALASVSAKTTVRPVIHPPFATAAQDKPVFIRCSKPRVYDGDTVVCASGYHLRLLGIQAPEIKCRAGIECIPGDAAAARDVFAQGIGTGRGVTYQYIRRDNRNRPVVIVRKMQSGRVLNLNCVQLEKTDSILKWDHRREIETECGL